MLSEKNIYFSFYDKIRKISIHIEKVLKNEKKICLNSEKKRTLRIFSVSAG